MMPEPTHTHGLEKMPTETKERVSERQLKRYISTTTKTLTATVRASASECPCAQFEQEQPEGAGSSSTLTSTMRRISAPSSMGEAGGAAGGA
jgi:hypothetical protein